MALDITVETDDGVEVDELETTGIVVKDGQGNKWVLPSGELEDYSDFALPEPLALPKEKLDPRFHYQFCRTDELSANLSRGFVAVTRQELGFKSLPESLARDYGQLQDSIYRVREMICIKIPVQFAVYSEKLKQKRADEAVMGAGPTDAMVSYAKERGIKVPLPSDMRNSGNLPRGVVEDYQLDRYSGDEPPRRQR